MRGNRSWNLIDNEKEFLSLAVNRKNHVHGFVQFVNERTSRGWYPYLTTFQFEQLGGNTKTVLAGMKNDIDRLYRMLLSRVQRFSRTSKGSQYVPILFSCAERPVFKRDKGRPQDVILNDGLHHNGILLLPPKSRLKTDLGEHFREKRQLYLRSTRLMTIDARPIHEDMERAVEYALKGIKNQKMPYDDAFIVLPKAVGELR